MTTLRQRLIDDVPSIVERLKPLFAKVVAVFAGKPGVRQVSVSVGLEKKPIDQLTDEDYQRIATRLAKLLQAKSNNKTTNKKTKTHNKHKTHKNKTKTTQS